MDVSIGYYTHLNKSEKIMFLTVYLVLSIAVVILNVTQATRSQNKQIYYFRKNNFSEPDSRLLIVAWTGDEKEGKGCEIFDDNNLITEVLKSSSHSEIQIVTESDAKDILEKCGKTNKREKRQSYFNVPYSSWRNYGRPTTGGTWKYVPSLSENTWQNNRSPPESAWRNYGHPLPKSPWQNNVPSSSESEWKNNAPSSSESTWQTSRIIRRQASTIAENGTNYVSSSTESSTADETGSEAGNSDSWNVIFPGTKWCGAGSTAADYNDLGFLEDTDKCCRAHDYCNDTIKAGETKHNLTNNTPFTQLSCECDNAFYDCLENVDSVTSNKIGNIYFNILRKDCYESDYPFTNKCKTHRSLLKITCKEYEKNTTAPKVYQYKNPRIYRNLPIPGPIDLKLPSIL